MLNRVNTSLWNGVHGGDFERLPCNAHDKVYAFVRTNENDAVLTICNLSEEEVELKLERTPEGDFKSLFGEDNLIDFTEGKALPPFAFHVFYKQ